jgi:uncharacterized protein YciI
MRRFLTVLALALTVSCASTSSDAPRAHEHTFAFLRIGPKRGETTGEPLQELMKGHMANIGKLAGERALLVAGPMGQGNPEPELRGVFVFASGDVSEAQALCASDPSIAAGVLAAEVVPLRTQQDLGAQLERALAFEERRKADPSIPMMDGMSTYALLVADEGARASKALAPARRCSCSTCARSPTPTCCSRRGAARWATTSSIRGSAASNCGAESAFVRRRDAF